MLHRMLPAPRAAPSCSLSRAAACGTARGRCVRTRTTATTCCRHAVPMHDRCMLTGVKAVLCASSCNPFLQNTPACMSWEAGTVLLCASRTKPGLACMLSQPGGGAACPGGLLGQAGHPCACPAGGALAGGRARAGCRAAGNAAQPGRWAGGCGGRSLARRGVAGLAGAERRRRLRGAPGQAVPLPPAARTPPPTAPMAW